MKNRLVTTWFGPTMPRLHALCIASWIDAGYEAVVYSYRDRIAGLPPGAKILDGEPILSQGKMFFLRNTGAYAHFSDIFRMELLRRGLGVWCDADYMALRPFPDTDEIMIARERKGWACNAVMWMTPEHPIAVGVVKNFERGGLAEWSYVKQRWQALLAGLRGRKLELAELPNGYWGRHALYYYTRKLNLTQKLLPQDTFYAEETYTGELFDAKPFDRLIDNEAVVGLHFFNKVRGDQEPVPGSLFAWAGARFHKHLG